MLRATVSVFALVLAGCSAGAAGVDAGSDAGRVDGGPSPVDSGGGAADGPPVGSAGLTFRFSANPALPQVATNVSVDEIRIWLREIRALGDSAPGDSRTSLAEGDLDLRTDRAPAPFAFPLAPPGIYSAFDVVLGQVGGGGDDKGYEIRGHVTIGGQAFELDVVDTEASEAIKVDLGGLRVEDATTVTIRINLDFLGDIDWASAPRDNDKIVLRAGDTTTQAISAGMMTSVFSLAP